jgi:7-cyano-7-deazaguanine synthase
MTEQLNTEKRAVILLSGGLDSATVVAMARQKATPATP